MARKTKTEGTAPRDHHLGMRLTEQDHKLLKKMAEEDERTMSNLIIVLIRKEARYRGLAK